jgi:hypothetical protein
MNYSLNCTRELSLRAIEFSANSAISFAHAWLS